MSTSANKMSRTFTIDKINDRSPRNSGRYVSANPAGAARKAFSKYCNRKRGPCKGVKVSIKETTRGSAGKTFVYKLSRVYDPVEVTRDGVTIVYNYRTTIKSMN